MRRLVEHLGLEPSSISLQGRSADPARAPIVRAPGAKTGARSWFRANLSAASARRFHQISFPSIQGRIASARHVSARRGEKWRRAEGSNLCPCGTPRFSGPIAGHSSGALRSIRRRATADRVQKLVGAAGFEPAISCSRSRRFGRLSYTPGIWRSVGKSNPSHCVDSAAASPEASRSLKHSKQWNSGRESNSLMAVLQTAAFPLRHRYTDGASDWRGWR